MGRCEHEVAAAELAERIRQRRAQGLTRGPTISVAVMERLRMLLPPPDPNTVCGEGVRNGLH